MNEVLPIARQVLTDKRVIGVAIAVFLYMDFASFVAKYRKKPPKRKIRKTIMSSSPEKAAAEKKPEEQTSQPAS
ncbi:MAG: hypothetical protein LKF96_02340 [Treponema sp.]|jgi:hypothetical protein|nr:hypothetical protein [Treponema sp.]